MHPLQAQYMLDWNSLSKNYSNKGWKFLSIFHWFKHRVKKETCYL